MSKTVSEILGEKISLFEKKQKEYGSTYKEYSCVMKSFFPSGLSLPGKETGCDIWNKFGIFNMIIHKMMRIARTNFKSIDSIKDIQVYAAMLEELMADEDNCNRL